jgi:hypothetical protein
MVWRERAIFFVGSSEIKGLGGMCIHGSDELKKKKPPGGGLSKNPIAQDIA